MSTHKKLPPVKLLHELLVYDPTTGAFIWRQRRREHFTATQRRTTKWLCLWWNKRFAGKPAGTMSPFGYTIIRINGVDYRASRIAWILLHSYEPDNVDHINGVRNDDREHNLRSVTFQENTKNAKLRTDNNSGVVGVGYYPLRGMWRARINHNGTSILLGYFKTRDEAVAARTAANRLYKYHKNHGRNLP